MPILRCLCCLALLAVPLTAGETVVKTFAVRTTPDVAELVERGSFQRWFAANDESLRLAAGPEASGEVVVEARLLPADGSLDRFFEGLPLRVDGEGIHLGGTSYADRQLTLAVRLPGAAKPNWVVAGYSAAAVASLADTVLISASGVRAHRFPDDFDYLLAESRYSRRSGRWHATEDGYAVDPEERDDMAARAASYAALATLKRPHVVLRAASTGVPYSSLAADLEAAVGVMIRRLPVAMEEPLEVFVESDFVVQGRHVAAIGEAVLDHDGGVHLVYHPDDLDAYRYGVARALVRRAALELPPWLEDGAALWLADTWYGRPYAGWLPDLAAGDVLATAGELLAGERQEDGSGVLWPPAAAAVVERLPGKTLHDKLATLPSAEQVAEILRRIGNDAPLGAARQRRSAASRGGFRNGVSLAMRNGLEVGYHAPGLDEKLAYLARLGSDSVSLMPFAWQPQPDGPGMGYLNRSPGSETDVGLIHAARRAHARGFRVLWKPHIWVSHGSWPGDVEMHSEDDWAAWWRSYRRYVLHHAVLAEWTGSEIFSIGVELGRTLGREAEWRSLIGAVRRVYSGRLTYCGNWWGDYDRVPFWDALDFVGVDAYFPLAGRADADRPALEAGARRAVAELEKAAARFGKPILLTEVGFAARKGAWVSPHEEGGELDEAHQNLAYEVFLDALGRRPWLAGVYFWKVFSSAAVAAGDRPDFRFLGRQAETVVRGYFASETSSPVATAQ